MEVLNILTDSYDEKLAKKILESYREIEQNYVFKKWKPSELDSGHFVEAIRRLLEKECTGTYTPLNEELPKFNDGVIKYFENQNVHESFKFHIPRSLISIYKIRNKRGVGHISEVSPNEMDSTYILYSVKWVLAEIVRIKSNLSIEETQKLVNNIVERKIDMLWAEDEIKRVLNIEMKADEQILFLLYHHNPQSDDELRNIIEYKNSSRFQNILNDLHNNRLIEFKENGMCHISPKGRNESEKIILKYGY